MANIGAAACGVTEKLFEKHRHKTTKHNGKKHKQTIQQLITDWIGTLLLCADFKTIVALAYICDDT